MVQDISSGKSQPKGILLFVFLSDMIFLLTGFCVFFLLIKSLMVHTNPYDRFVYVVIIT